MAASLGLTRRYQPIGVASPAARYGSVRFRADIAKAPALVAVSSIRSAGAPGPFAIGIWTRYLDPRLAFPLTHPVRREPDTADVALLVSPTLVGTLLMGDYKGYVVGNWSADLVAAELSGLAVWTASQRDLHERTGPWEDPVVQRATELDLGVRLPSDLIVYPIWAGEANDLDGIAALETLVSTFTALLNVPAGGSAPIRSHP
jgi:hypothetical protein